MPKRASLAKTTKQKVHVYETTAPLLAAMYMQIQELCKKKPEATLNANKVSLINRLLTDIKELLANEPANKYLDLIDDEQLPQYSDVVLILSQYSAAMERFLAHYKELDLSGHGDWNIS